MGFGLRMAAFAKFSAAACACARKLRADLVFATSTPLTICIPAIYAARRWNVPMVFEVRDLWPEVPIALGILRNPALVHAARRLERYAYANASHVVALSPGMADGVVRRGVPRARVHVIPNGCDIDRTTDRETHRRAFLERHPELAGKKLVTYTGTIGLIYGVEYLVQVAARLRHRPDIHFLVVGDGKRRAALERCAREAGVLGANFELWPPAPKAEIPEMLAASSVAVSLVIPEPALWHNSANKFFDALATSTPVLINYEGWQAELLRETKAGIVVPSDDPEAAAAALVAFLDAPERLAAARTAAGTLARTRFDRDAQAERLLDVLGAAHRDGSHPLAHVGA